MSARDLEQFDKPLKLRCPWILEPSLAGLSIYGPKADGTHIVEFKTATGEALAISIPRTEVAVVRHFQAKMPYGLVIWRQRSRTWKS